MAWNLHVGRVYNTHSVPNSAWLKTIARLCMNRNERIGWNDWFRSRGLRLVAPERPADPGDSAALQTARQGTAWQLVPDGDLDDEDSRSHGDDNWPGVVLFFQGQDEAVWDHCDNLNQAAVIGWAPRGLPGGFRICLLSSRIGRHPERFPWWINALRTACIVAARSDAVLLYGEGMTATPFVARMAQLLGIEKIEFRTAPCPASGQWFRSQMQRSTGAGKLPDATHFPLWLLAQNQADAPESLDAWVASQSDQFRTLFVTPGGTIETILRSGLASGLKQTARCWLLGGESTTSQELHLDLVNRGAVPWMVHDDELSGPSPPQFLNTDGMAEVVPAPEDLGEYLAHWTRAVAVGTGDASQFGAIDRILFAGMGEKDGALTSLVAILVTGRLVGSASLTRDSAPVVSLTATPLDEFRERRVFRSHLGRWDFELYGVAIRRSVLERLGARPVVYGDDDRWEELSADERPYFQHRGLAQDWTVEREWRIQGDIDLRKLGPEDVFVFVPNREVAAKAAPYSRWKIVIVPSGG